MEEFLKQLIVTECCYTDGPFSGRTVVIYDGRNVSYKLYRKYYNKFIEQQIYQQKQRGK